MSPEEIESQIENAYLRLSHGKTPHERRKAWEDLRYWKTQRAPEIVEQKERERGLR